MGTEDQLSKGRTGVPGRRGVSPVRALAAHKGVRSLSRRLGVSGLLRRLYFLCFRRKVRGRSVLRVTFRGRTLFYDTPSSFEFRVVDRIFTTGERDSLEALASALLPGDTVWDVGCRVGEFTVPLAKTVGPSGQVVALEPDPSVRGRLKANLDLNQLENVRVFPLALGREAGKAQLAWTENSCPSLLPKKQPGPGSAREGELASLPNGGGRVEVEVLPGDQLRQRERLPVPNAIKIDVEGFEYEVLSGLKETLACPECRMLCCEIHKYLGVAVEPIQDFVKSLGFAKIHINADKGWEGVGVALLAWK